MAGPREEVEAQPVLDAPCAAAALFGVGARDEGFEEAGELAAFVESGIGVRYNLE